MVTLLRLGVGRFRIADPDHFELPNINRQYGATTATLGRSKVEVMAEVARTINPEVEISLFPEGFTGDNSEAFFREADVAIDGIDFFATDTRRLFFQQARKRGLYAVTSGPLGFSATLHIFSPEGMSFDEYFGIHDGMAPGDTLVSFIVGLAPQALHLPYMDLTKVDSRAQTGPSSSIACQLCSGIVGAEVLNILLKRRRPVVAPRYFQFDAYRHRYAQGYLWLGNRNPIQRFKRWYMKRRLGLELRG
jgi:molybdopterin/thiamine biosynthesis adenylyltransferase